MGWHPTAGGTLPLPLALLLAALWLGAGQGPLALVLLVAWLVAPRVVDALTWAPARRYAWTSP